MCYLLVDTHTSEENIATFLEKIKKNTGATVSVINLSTNPTFSANDRVYILSIGRAFSAEIHDYIAGADARMYYVLNVDTHSNYYSPSRFFHEGGIASSERFEPVPRRVLVKAPQLGEKLYILPDFRKNYTISAV